MEVERYWGLVRPSGNSALDNRPYDDRNNIVRTGGFMGNAVVLPPASKKNTNK